MLAMYSGTVVTVETSHAKYGIFVRIRSYPNQANSAGFEHTYAHLSEVAEVSESKLKNGDPVDKGDLTGLSGMTGGGAPVRPVGRGGSRLLRYSGRHPGGG